MEAEGTVPSPQVMELTSSEAGTGGDGRTTEQSSMNLRSALSKALGLLSRDLLCLDRL